MQKFDVIYEDGSRDRFKPHEKRAAKILAEHFQSDIIMQRQQLSKTPDLKVRRDNTRWEIKSPLGNGKRTIDNNLRQATHQSQNIIIDPTYCKMPDAKAIARARNFVQRKEYPIKRLKILLKNEKIIDILLK